MLRTRDLCRKRKWTKPSMDQRAPTINKSLAARRNACSFHGFAWIITKYSTIISKRKSDVDVRPDTFIWIIQRARPTRNRRDEERTNHRSLWRFFCLQLAHRDIHRVLFCCSLTHSSPIPVQVPASATSPSPRPLRALLLPLCHRYPRICRVTISSTRRCSPFVIFPRFRSLKSSSFHSSSLSSSLSLHFAHCPPSFPRHRLAPRRRRWPSSRTTIVSQRSVSYNFITPLS